jgi:hypothetical protein
LGCNEETGQQDSETGEHSNLEQQIQRRSYTGYRGLWKKVNGVERRLQLGTGSGGGSSSGSSNNKNNIQHSQKKNTSLNKVVCAEMTSGIKGSRSFLHHLL